MEAAIILLACSSLYTAVTSSPHCAFPTDEFSAGSSSYRFYVSTITNASSSPKFTLTNPKSNLTDSIDSGTHVLFNCTSQPRFRIYQCQQNREWHPTVINSCSYSDDNDGNDFRAVKSFLPLNSVSQMNDMSYLNEPLSSPQNLKLSNSEKGPPPLNLVGTSYYFNKTNYMQGEVDADGSRSWSFSLYVTAKQAENSGPIWTLVTIDNNQEIYLDYDHNASSTLMLKLPFWPETLNGTCDLLNKWRFVHFSTNYLKNETRIFCDDVEIFSSDEFINATFRTLAKRNFYVGKQPNTWNGFSGSISCLMFKHGGSSDPESRKMLKQTCNIVNALRPVSNPAIDCAAIPTYCNYTLSLEKSIFPSRYHQWLYRGSAAPSLDGLSLRLSDRYPNIWGTVWSKDANEVRFDDNWRYEITFTPTQQIDDAQFAIILNAFYGSNYNNIEYLNLDYGYDHRMFAGVIIYIDPVLQQVNISIADWERLYWSLSSTHKKAAYNTSFWTFDDFDWKKPQKIVLEYVKNMFALTLINSDGAIKQFVQRSVAAALKNLQKNHPSARFGFGASFGPEATPSLKPPEIISIMYYDVVPTNITKPATSTTSTTTTSSTEASSTKTAIKEFQYEVEGLIRIDKVIELPSSLEIVPTNDSFGGYLNLFDSSSDEFQQLRQYVQPQICLLYPDFSNCECTIRSFALGSIVADYVVALKSLTQLTDAEIEQKVAEMFSHYRPDETKVFSLVESQNITRISAFQGGNPVAESKSEKPNVKQQQSGATSDGLHLGMSFELLVGLLLVLSRF